MNKYRLLICDDEQEIIDLLKLYLRGEEYEIFEANDGNEALEILKTEPIDLILLDIMMPKINGLEVIKLIRDKITSPILIISARTTLSDRLLAYDIGADDYIVKPFEPLEVAAKVKSRLREKEALDSELQVGDIILNLETCTLTVGETTHALTKVEFQILKLFMQEPGRVFTKAQIYRAGWDEDYLNDDNSIFVIINRLRAKVGETKIETIRGLGYRFKK